MLWGSTRRNPPHLRPLPVAREVALVQARKLRFGNFEEAFPVAGLWKRLTFGESIH
jgi:hypothetical protein